ncbi:MAG TPA: ATP-binding protein [Halomicronema sp.]
MKNLIDYGSQITVVREHLIALHACVKQLPKEHIDSLPESFEAVYAIVEELNTAQEELQVQNEQLQETRLALDAERQRYQRLFEFAPDGYLVTDENGKILEANQMAAGMLNVSQRFLVGKPLSVFISADDRPVFRCRVTDLKLGRFQRLQEWEVHLQPREGNCIETALTVAAVCNDQGKVLGLRWLLRDITVRKQTERQLAEINLENLRLQESARLKSNFLATVSHELRTPMNAIMGFSQLLIRQFQNQPHAKQAELADRILNNGRHLLTLINDILDFSKIEAGCQKLSLESFNIKELVNATIADLSCLAVDKNIFLEGEVNLENVIVVNDSLRVRQIIVNFLSNAIKFTETGGVRLQILESGDYGERLVLVIRDTGIGIAEEDFECIFDAFHQLDQGSTRRYQGTGLGLAIVRGLVLLMNGKISVESNVGDGSTFRVEFPRVVEQRA